MGGLALLAFGGLVALAASAASSRSASPAPEIPPPGGYPPPPGLPPQVASPPQVPAPRAPTPQAQPPAAPAPQVQAPAAPPPNPYPAPPAPAPTIYEPAPPPVPTPAIPGVPGLPNPGSTTELVQWLRTWLASNPPPAQVELVAARLDEAGMAETATQLRAWAQRAREQGGATPVPSPSPPTPRPVLVPDPPPGPTSPAPSPRPPGPAPVPTPAPRPAEPSPSGIDSGDAPGLAVPAEPSSAPSLAAATAVALQQRWTEIQDLIRQFQRAARIGADGRYGRVTRAALSFWTGRTAPRPWVGSGTAMYRADDVERGDGSALARNAERRARLLFVALTAPEGSARPHVERFQRASRLTVDGKYGAQTRVALVRQGVPQPPPVFRRTRSRRGRRNRR